VHYPEIPQFSLLAGRLSWFVSGNQSTGCWSPAMGLSAGKACTLHNGVNITPALQGKLIDRYEVNNYESFAT